MGRIQRAVVLGVVVAAAQVVAPQEAAASGTSVLAGAAANGSPANARTVPPRMITSDGRYVLFTSPATNLVAAATHGVPQVFLKDLRSGAVDLISVNNAGAAGTDQSHAYYVSPDGRFVTFTSYASDLVPGDTNQQPDAFLRDRLMGTTERVSLQSDGRQITRGGSVGQVTNDGTEVLFTSTGTVTPQDVHNDGSTYVRNRRSGTVEPLLHYVIRSGVTGQYPSSDVTISGDGRYAAFRARPGLLPDDNDYWQAYLKDRVTGSVTRLTNAPDGSPQNRNHNNGTISNDGRFYAYTSEATNLDPAHPNVWLSVFLLDRSTGRTENVGVGANGVLNGPAAQLSVSRNGRYVAFGSYATNVVAPPTPAGRTLAYVRDRTAGVTRLVSVTATGQLPDGNVGPDPFALTADGGHLLVNSGARNLLPTPDLSYQQAVVLPNETDTTAPQVRPVLATPANEHGWHNAPVLITWAVEDPEPSSGQPTQPPPVLAHIEGPDQVYHSQPACDPAGNCGVGQATISLDTHPPTGTVTPQRPPDTAGWYSSAIALVFTCTDPTSGIDVCPASITLTTDGKNQTVTGTAHDRAGNTATIGLATPVNIDTTAPLVSVDGPQDQHTYPLGNIPPARCTTTDALSGVATSATLTLTRGPGGAYTAACTGALDTAGNPGSTTITYTVRPTTTSLQALTTQYVAETGAPNAPGAAKNLNQLLEKQQVCEYIKQVHRHATQPPNALTTDQAAELTYWAHLLEPDC